MHSAGEVPLATIASPRDVPVGAAPQPLSTFFGLTLTDPTSVIPQNGSLFARLCNGLILDPRDRPFIALSLQASIVIVPFAAFLFWPGAFNWWLGGVYLMLNFGFFVDRYVLMLHNTCHRPLFRRRYKFLNFYIPNFLGPFFGETPNTYLCHHLGMHHPENNLRGDLSSTMRFDRDNVLHPCQRLGSKGSWPHQPAAGSRNVPRKNGRFAEEAKQIRRGARALSRGAVAVYRDIGEGSEQWFLAARCGGQLRTNRRCPRRLGQV